MLEINNQRNLRLMIESKISSYDCIYPSTLQTEVFQLENISLIYFLGKHNISQA